MKWLKLHTDSSTLSPYMSIVEDRFGLAGYARMIKLKEAIASQMLTKESDASVEYPSRKWSQILYCKKKGLDSFLDFLAEKSIISLERTENGIKVTFDKLRDSLDNRAASSNLREPSGNPYKNRLDQEEKIPEDKRDDRDDDCDFQSNLKKILLGTNIKEDLVQFLIESWHNGNSVHTNRNIILKEIEKHFSGNSRSEKAVRFGAVIQAIAKNVLNIIQEYDSKDTSLWPSAKAIVKVFDKGKAPLEEDGEYLSIKRDLKKNKFSEDELFYVSQRRNVLGRPKAPWIQKYEKQLAQRKVLQ